jgi:hypothetical protein
VLFRSPHAILVDRLESQQQGITVGFGETEPLLGFCTAHLGANIKTILGTNSPVLAAFWKLVKEAGPEQDFLDVLHEQRARLRAPRQLNFLVTLPDRTKSRNEGFFGKARWQIGHARVPLPKAAFAFIDLGRDAMIHRGPLKRDIPVIPEWIMSLDDQKQLGHWAAETIQTEVQKYEVCVAQTNPTVSLCNFKDCPAAKRWGLPCMHLIKARLEGAQYPVLSLADVPLRWHRDDWVQEAPAQHLCDRTPAPVPSRGRAVDARLFFAQFFAEAEPVVRAAVRDPHLMDMCGKFLEDVRAAYRPAPVRRADGIPPDEMIWDPSRLPVPGRQDCTPRNKSSLNRAPCAASCGDPKKMKKPECSACGSTAHCITYCPFLAEEREQTRRKKK